MADPTELIACRAHIRPNLSTTELIAGEAQPSGRESGARGSHLATGIGATDFIWPSSPRTSPHPPSWASQW